MQRRPAGVSVVAVLYFLGTAGYAALLLGWIFARPQMISFVEQATPSASLGPALLQDVPGVVTTYLAVMAGFCCWVGIGLWKLQRWSWFVTCVFAIFSFIFDFGLLVHMLRHLPTLLAVVGVLRLVFLVLIVGYFSRTSIRAAFGLVRQRAAGQG